MFDDLKTAAKVALGLACPAVGILFVLSGDSSAAPPPPPVTAPPAPPTCSFEATVLDVTDGPPGSPVAGVPVLFSVQGDPNHRGVWTAGDTATTGTARADGLACSTTTIWMGYVPTGYRAVEATVQTFWWQGEGRGGHAVRSFLIERVPVEDTDDSYLGGDIEPGDGWGDEPGDAVAMPGGGLSPTEEIDEINEEDERGAGDGTGTAGPPSDSRTTGSASDGAPSRNPTAGLPAPDLDAEPPEAPAPGNDASASGSDLRDPPEPDPGTPPTEPDPATPPADTGGTGIGLPYPPTEP